MVSILFIVYCWFGICRHNLLLSDKWGNRVYKRLDSTIVKFARWLFYDHFWSLRDVVVIRIFLPKSKPTFQVKICKFSIHFVLTKIDHQTPFLNSDSVSLP
jgi:hypothetical protein